MALQFSPTYRNAMLDAIESTAGASAKVNIFSGTAPANCTASVTGTLIGQFSLPADWPSASAGTKNFLTGTLSTTAVASNTATHFRVYDSSNTTCHMQGTVGQGSGDMSLDNVIITTGQTVQITTWTATAPGA